MSEQNLMLYVATDDEAGPAHDDWLDRHDYL